MWKTVWRMWITSRREIWNIFYVNLFKRRKKEFVVFLEKKQNKFVKKITSLFRRISQLFGEDRRFVPKKEKTLIYFLQVNLQKYGKYYSWRCVYQKRCGKVLTMGKRYDKIPFSFDRVVLFKTEVCWCSSAGRAADS